MFETLSDRLQVAFQHIGSKGRLDEADVDEALKEVRRALIESDVNFKVVKDFVAHVREKAIGQDVMRSLTPAQMVLKIVQDELTALLGEAAPLLRSSKPPSIYMLVGLQGSGKTTTVAKLGLQLKRNNQSPLLVAADVYRPAAVHQLETLGKQLNIPVYSEGTQANPVDICERALARAAELRSGVVILDTAGRLHIDEGMMDEIAQIKERVHPTEILLVVDAMTGQDAVRVAEAFNAQVGITGVVLTKVDGDARGGAALSVRQVTGVPIKLMGSGEKTDALEPFYPDRLVQRILGMGDVMTLIERAQVEYDADEAAAMQKKILKATFDLDDFLNQLQMVKKLGPLQQIMEMIPGMGAAMRQSDVKVDEDDFKHIEAIIRSMTGKERRRPDIIDSSRRRRIAKGSGTTTQEVNMLLNQFKQMQKMMKQMGGWDGKGKPPRGVRGMMNMFR
jgi:signal recognition particle subunit SRP54